jgi:transcriptional regulator with XRE-family HTH domain
MGRSRRGRPKRLPRKLLLIRQRLGMSQSEIAEALKLKVHYSAVSNYEKGSREPDLLILLRYARLAKVSLESLIDDKTDLPD